MNVKFLGISRRIWCHVIAATFAASVVAPITFMSLDREPPFRLRDGVTHPDQIVRGGKFQLEWTIVINRKCEASVWSVIRADVDQRLSFESISTTAKQASLFGEAPIPLNKPARIQGRLRDVPVNLPLGPIVIETWQEAYCNPLQRIFDWPIVWKQQDIKTILRGE